MASIYVRTASDGLPVEQHLAAFQHHAARAQVQHGAHVVADEKHRASARRHVAHLAKALALELGVADGENLVDDEDFGLEMCGDGKRQADPHAAGVALHGRIDERPDSGELDDLVELPIDLDASHAENRAVQIDVLAPGQLGMKARARLPRGTPGDLESRPGRRWAR